MSPSPCAGDDLNSRHCTVSCTDANTAICTDARITKPPIPQTTDRRGLRLCLSESESSSENELLGFAKNRPMWGVSGTNTNEQALTYRSPEPVAPVRNHGRFSFAESGRTSGSVRERSLKTTEIMLAVYMEVTVMSDQVVQDFSRVVDNFKEMRDRMHNEGYSHQQLVAADRLYSAIRQFAPEIGCSPPYLPMGDGN